MHWLCLFSNDRLHVSEFFNVSTVFVISTGFDDRCFDIMSPPDVLATFTVLFTVVAKLANLDKVISTVGMAAIAAGKATTDVMPSVRFVFDCCS